MRATTKGAGLSSDSVTYLHAARNLIRHHVLITRIDRTSHLVRPTHYPPLYPATVALSAAMGGTVEGAARGLQVATVVVSGGCFAVILRRYVRPAAVVAGVAVLVVSSGFLVEMNGFALSEGLFLCWTLVALLLLLHWLDRDDQVATDHPDGRVDDHRLLLVAAAGAAGAAALTRFVGVAVIGTGIMAITVLEERRSWARTSLFAAVSSLPLLGWMAYSSATGEGAIGARALAVHLPPEAKVREGVRTASAWIVPQRALDQVPHWLVEAGGALVLAALIGVIVGLARERPPGQPVVAGDGAVTVLGRTLAVFAALYLGVVVLTISLLDTATPLDRRILLPLFVAGLLAAVVTVDRVVGRRPAPARWAVTGCVVLALLAVNARATSAEVADARRDGLGYASDTWRGSTLVGAVRRLPADVAVYSNAAGALFELTGRRSLSIAPRFYGNGSGADPGYPAGIALMAKRVRAGQAVVVWFRSANHWFGTDLPGLRRALGTRPTLRAADGVLFGHVQRPAPRADP